MPASQNGLMVWAQICSLLLPANTPAKAADDSPGTSMFGIEVKYQDEDPGLRLLPDPILANVCFWEVIWQTKEVFLSVLVALPYKQIVN